jgi:tetratricopeptide (TPR) repeat protein
MSIEEAKKVTATFGGAAFVPPPRTINDITAILDQQKRTAPETARDLADAAPPTSTDRGVLAQFYFKRGLAAEEIGRAKQEIDDLTKTLEYARPRSSPSINEILFSLSLAELRAGDYSRGIEHRRKAIEAVPSQRGELLKFYATLAWNYTEFGDLKAAERALAETSTLYSEYLRLKPGRPSAGQLLFLQAQAGLLEAKGKHAEAEALYREAVAVLAGDPVYAQHWWMDSEHSFLARTLIRCGISSWGGRRSQNRRSRFLVKPR